jgi:hypothetical protein
MRVGMKRVSRVRVRPRVRRLQLIIVDRVQMLASGRWRRVPSQHADEDDKEERVVMVVVQGG